MNVPLNRYFARQRRRPVRHCGSAFASTAAASRPVGGEQRITRGRVIIHGGNHPFSEQWKRWPGLYRIPGKWFGDDPGNHRLAGTEAELTALDRRPVPTEAELRRPCRNRAWSRRT